MKSTENKLPLDQVERGDELKKIDEKAIDNEVVHKNVEEEDVFTKINFKKNPSSEKDATSGSGLVTKRQLDSGLKEKAEDSEVVHTTKNESIGGVKSFLKSPKSDVAASTDKDLVRKKEVDSGLDGKVDKETGKGLSTNDFDNPQKQKLEGIEEGAQVNTVDSVNGKEGKVKLDASNIDETGDRKWAAESGADKTEDHTSKDSNKLGGKEPSYYAKDSEVVKSSEKGANGGVATLNNSGKVPSAQLPDMPNAVVTETTKSNFPTTGEENTLYVAADTGLQYVWNGSDYTQTSTNLSLGESSNTAYRGDRGKAAYDHSKKTSGNPHNVTKEDVGLSKVTNDIQLKRDSNLSDLPNKSKSRSNLGLGTAAVKNEEDFAKPSDIKDPKITIKQEGESDQSFTLNQSGAKTINLKNTKYSKATSSKDGLQSKEHFTKVEGVEEGAQKNIKADWLELDGASDRYIQGKHSLETVTDEFHWFPGNSQIFDVDFRMNQLISVTVNGQKLSKSQYDQRAKGIEILDELTGLPGNNPEIITIEYKTETIWENLHGFEFDITVAAPEVTRIGNSELNQNFPIQSRMRGCLLKDNGEVNYYLDSQDWSKKEDGSASNLDGTDGQVMVEMPRHFVIDYQKENIRRRIYSETPFPGAMEYPKFYVSAYKAALYRPDNKLSSVVNLSADYRGGNNQSSWDSENQFKSQLGKPVSNKDRIDFRSFSKNRGENWYDMDYYARESIAWLITHEFGSRDHQNALSQGPTTLVSSDWTSFNSRYPLFRCGITNDFGNGTGEKTVTLLDYPTSGQSEEIVVFRYRGIENFYGDIYEWTNGINIIDNKYYLNPINRKKIEDDTPEGTDGYILIGERPTNDVNTSSYIKEMHPGTILPKVVGGSSNTYYGDRLYYNDAATIRGLYFGGSASHVANAGSFIADSSRAPTYELAYIGSRLCFFWR